MLDRWQRDKDDGVVEEYLNRGITIFTTPKPFRGITGIIQKNALQSWLSRVTNCEIILFGDEEGTAEIASQFGVQHIADVACNEYGTPLISSMFRIAQDIANYPIMCYINSDIILMSDFLPAICQIKWRSFLIIGQRWDIDLKDALDFSNQLWEKNLRGCLTKGATLHGIGGLDYFIFPRGMYSDIPPFAVGRPKWDNWMVYQARLLKVPVIDATKAITAVHQNHDYPKHLKKENGDWKGPEAAQNIKLAGEGENGFDTNNATWILTQQGLKRALARRHLCAQLRAIPVLNPCLGFLNLPIRVFPRLIRHVLRKIGILPR